MTEEPRLDIEALKALMQSHPEEFRKLREAVETSLLDKHGRTIVVTDNVLTPQGEKGMVIRIDKKSKRVLVRLDAPVNGHTTRMLMAHRVTVRRGRPRRDEANAI